MVMGRRLGAAVLLAALVLLEGFFGLQPGHVATMPAHLEVQQSAGAESLLSQLFTQILK